MRVTVFGGAAPKAGEPAYEEALLLGRLLGEAGHTVLTGGYIGTMEAVSRGASQAGGHVIGVTCEEIEAWRGVKANQWVAEEIRFATLHERLLALVTECDAAMALPGGIGTLAEISVMWNNMYIDALPQRPLILIGAGWQSVIESFNQSLTAYVTEKCRQMLTLAPDVPAAVAALKGASNQEGSA